jgi:hypothetical protein
MCAKVPSAGRRDYVFFRRNLDVTGVAWQAIHLLRCCHSIFKTPKESSASFIAALPARNLAVERLTRTNSLFHGSYANFKLDRVGLENSGFVKRSPVILEHWALLRRCMLCSYVDEVSAVPYQAG